jgi:hypothetical protein
MPPPPPRNATPVKAAAGAASAAKTPVKAAVVAKAYPPPCPSPEGLKSITIADYKSDSDSDEDDAKPRPQAAWADRSLLKRSLRRQATMDPDSIFQSRDRTCRLEEVFSAKKVVKPGQRDLSKRKSSGNWTRDQLTWRVRASFFSL